MSDCRVPMFPAKGSNWVYYKNGNCLVSLNTVNGTKIRYTPDDEYRPRYPESMDIKITNYCDRGCAWCHEDSTKDGYHAVINQAFLDTIPPYREIAVGGGNVLSHPLLEDFLKLLKEKKCFPSITVNQDHFLKEFYRIKRLYDDGLVYGVGVSYVPKIKGLGMHESTEQYIPEELFEKMHEIPTSVLHTIAGIIGETDLELLSGHDLKILVLGYKCIRRGELYLTKWAGGSVYSSNPVLDNIEWLKGNLDKLFDGFSVVSFDNLALDQLNVEEYVGNDVWEDRYMGDDGQFTFYIDMVNKEYAVSSTEAADRRFPILGKSVRDMFEHVQKISKIEERENK